MKLFYLLPTVIALVCLPGCATGPPPQSINEKPLARIAVVDETGLFAADQEGRTLALAQSGLSLLNLETKETQKLSPDIPVALSWSPDGSLLAAAFLISDYETRLTRYSSQGQLLHEDILPAVLSKLVWSARGDLLITGLSLKNYSFGGDLQQVLYLVSGAEVTETVLSGATLKLATVKYLTSKNQNVHPVAFSPYGDELVYVHLHDPPQFMPYLELLYHNWQVGGSRSLQKFPLQTLELDWDEEQSVAVRSLNGEQRLALWPAADETSPQPAATNYRFDKGQLFAGEELLADWGEGAQLQILSDGRFLLAVQSGLYLGSGLRAESFASYSEKTWTLRRWRFEGLITPVEYQELLRKETP